LDIRNIVKQGAVSFLSDMVTDNKNHPQIRQLPNNARCVIEMAMLDLMCRMEQLSLGEVLTAVFPKAPPASRKVTRVLDSRRELAEFLGCDGPFHCVKLKATSDVIADRAKVAELRRCLGDEIEIIVDANMGWSDADAPERIRTLSSAGATLFEEPIEAHKFEELAKLRRQTRQPIMLDETLLSLRDGKKAIDLSAADAFNIRISKNGGISKSLRLVDVALQAGIRWQLGVQVAEVGPLVAAERHFASSIGGYFSLEGGIGDEVFEEFVADPYPFPDRVTNTISPPEGYGLGLVLSDNITKFLVNNI